MQHRVFAAPAAAVVVAPVVPLIPGAALDDDGTEMTKEVSFEETQERARVAGVCVPPTSSD
jgi:hypothetical protein